MTGIALILGAVAILLLIIATALKRLVTVLDALNTNHAKWIKTDLDERQQRAARRGPGGWQ